jgi:adenylate cyclase
MKKESGKISQVIILMALYIGGLILFRILNKLGSDASMIKKLPDGIMSLGLAFGGIVTGAGMAFIEFNVLPRIAHLPSRLYALSRFLITTTTVSSGIVLIQILFAKAYFEKSWAATFVDTGMFLQTGIFWSSFIYLMLFSVILSLFKVVHYHIGPGTMFNFISGKYRIPQEEDRIFLFIDLKSSTTIAEQLGHARYSRFLNTCFNDLAEVIKLHHAEIYQFVGDEAVLTWRTDADKKKANCVKLFYAFKKRLAQNRILYLEKFGIFPEFKAAAHTGLVSASEAQGGKRELLYHGDVLNTCARILELCSRYKKELLLSESVANWIRQSPHYTIQHVEECILRGKEEYTSVFEVFETRATTVSTPSGI